MCSTVRGMKGTKTSKAVALSNLYIKRKGKKIHIYITNCLITVFQPLGYVACWSPLTAFYCTGQHMDWEPQPAVGQIHFQGLLLFQNLLWPHHPDMLICVKGLFALEPGRQFVQRHHLERWLGPGPPVLLWRQKNTVKNFHVRK